jgi:pimeloyl-ACP methyl ester carboxylesterase
MSGKGKNITVFWHRIPGEAAMSTSEDRTGVASGTRRGSRLSTSKRSRPIKAPTLVIWGQRDRYLGEELAEPDHDDVPGLDRIEWLPDASHWVHHDHDGAERVNQLLIDFFAPARSAGN